MAWAAAKRTFGAFMVVVDLIDLFHAVKGWAAVGYPLGANLIRSPDTAWTLWVCFEVSMIFYIWGPLAMGRRIVPPSELAS